MGGLQQPGKARKHSPLEPLEKMQPWSHLGFRSVRLIGILTYRTIRQVVVKLLNLWSFITAVIVS